MGLEENEMKRNILRGLFGLMRNADCQAKSGNIDGMKNMMWLAGNLTAEPDLLKNAMCMKPEGQVSLTFGENLSIRLISESINIQNSYEAV